MQKVSSCFVWKEKVVEVNGHINEKNENKKKSKLRPKITSP